MRQFISGHVFEQHGHRLTCRKSWRSFVAGCVLALGAVGVGSAIASNWLADRNVYVGGTRHFRGRAIDPAHQTLWQKTEYYGLLVLFVGPFFIVPLAYALFGSDEQRSPLAFDRDADQVTRGRKILCKASAIVAVRLVETSHSASHRGPTGVFARVQGPPWSIQLGGFNRYTNARNFALPIGNFLGVSTYDDPLFPRADNRPGFPVVVPAADAAGPPDAHTRRSDQPATGARG